MGRAKNLSLMAQERRPLSIVLPVRNEARILRAQASALLSSVEPYASPVELLLVENGSTDGSGELCLALSRELDGVRALILPTGDYGAALKAGIQAAAHEFIFIANVDFWSVEFLVEALDGCAEIDLVIGSKQARGARDDRPWLRRAITRGYNQLLREVWGFSGTDTHGMKIMRRDSLLAIVEACVSSGFIFDTELVLRAQRAGLRTLEIPTDVSELRAHSVQTLAKRVPDVLFQLFRLGLVLPPRWREAGR